MTRTPAFRAATLATALLAAAWLAACAAYVDQRLENTLREALPGLVGPAERYEVTVRGADRGGSRIEHVRAVGVRVQRPEGPVLARVEIDLEGVVVDREERRVTSIGRARAALHLSEQDLGAWLARQPWVQAATVRFSGADGVAVAGAFGVPGVPALSSPRAELHGRVLAQGSRLLLRIEAISLGERTAPGAVRRVLEEAVNPLVDLADHAVPSQVDSVQVSNAELVIRASGSDLRVRGAAGR